MNNSPTWIFSISLPFHVRYTKCLAAAIGLYLHEVQKKGQSVLIKNLNKRKARGWGHHSSWPSPPQQWDSAQRIMAHHHYWCHFLLVQEMYELSPEDTVQFLFSTAIYPPSTWSRDAVWSRHLPGECFSGRLPACAPAECEEIQRNWMHRDLGCTGGKHISLAQNLGISGPRFPSPGIGCSRPRAPSQAKKRCELFHWDPLHSYNTSSAPILFSSFTSFHQQLGAAWAWAQSNNFEVYWNPPVGLYHLHHEAASFLYFSIWA